MDILLYATQYNNSAFGMAAEIHKNETYVINKVLSCLILQNINISVYRHTSTREVSPFLVDCLFHTVYKEISKRESIFFLISAKIPSFPDMAAHHTETALRSALVNKGGWRGEMPATAEGDLGTPQVKRAPAK